MAPSFRFLVTGVLSIATTILFSVILGACTTPSPPEPYLFRIVDKDFEVRAAYFGVCTGRIVNVTCSSNAGEWHTINEAPAQYRNHIRMALDVRKKVFSPWLTALAAALFLLVMPLMFYIQSLNVLTKNKAFVDTAVFYGSGLSALFSILAVAEFEFGQKGVMFAVKFLGNGGIKVDFGDSMKILQRGVSGLCLVLFLINWLARQDGSVAKLVSCFFFARNDGRGKMHPSS